MKIFYPFVDFFGNYVYFCTEKLDLLNLCIMAQSFLEIPEWTGSPLTMASFLAFCSSINDQAAGVETANQYFLDQSSALNTLVDRFRDFINQQRAYEQTPEIAKQDSKRDFLWKAFWYAWYYIDQLDPTDPLAQHAMVLRPVMNAYKGMWKHEMTKETEEIKGLQRDLQPQNMQDALQALGLNIIAQEIFVANACLATAVQQREAARGQRIAEKGDDSTESLRKQMTPVLTEIFRQANAMVRIAPGDSIRQFVQNVCGIINHYKQVAASGASHGKDDTEPQPEPQPEPEPTPEPEPEA